MPVSIRQFRAFVRLIDEPHFTRAAAALHLSQPAFSALVGAMEGELGVRLFDRSKRHVVLTPEGAALEAPARRALAEFDAAVDSVHDRAALRHGRVSIALLPSLAANWLPEVLKRFLSLHPGIQIGVSDVLSEACIDQVLSGRADFAVAAIRADSPHLLTESFCTDDAYLVCPAKHALARAETLQVADLAPWPFIHLSRTTSVRQVLEAALHPLSMNTLMEVDQLSTVMGMVRAGLGISVVPAMTLFHFRHPQIALRPMPLKRLQRRLYLVRRSDRSLSAAAQALCDFALAMRPEPVESAKSVSPPKAKRPAIRR